ncbi:histidine phosphatase family protein [Candidatus Pacearchaeota archaeon]|nr:histidine phosphatase family protein [Candidatus Pacearchaeota archaeon]
MNNGFKVFLFRHGQTTFNRDGRFTGWLDPRLTKLGEKQARIVARKLKNKKFGIAFYTRLRRSKQTLKEVLRHHPECKTIIKDDKMIERNYGNLNGVSHKSFIRGVGKKLYDLEVFGDAFEDLSKENRGKIEEFLGEEEYNLIHRGFNVPPPNGESFAMVEKRVKRFIENLKMLIRKEKTNVVISAHGNAIRLFRKIMENASQEEALKWFIPYDKVYEYDL